VIPVTLPPDEAQGTVKQPTRGKRGKGRTQKPAAPPHRIFTPAQGRLEPDTAVLHYPYRRGAIYVVRTAPQHPSTLILPPGMVTAVPPVLDTSQETGQWDVGYAPMMLDDDLQEAIVLRPRYTTGQATTPILTKTGERLLVRLQVQEQPGDLMVTWDIPQGNSKKLEPQTLQAPSIDLARLHTQYRLEPGKQPVNWLPVEIYDDAKLTVIRFAESLEFTAAPVLFALTADGKQTVPLEYTTYSVPGHPEKGEFYLTRGLHSRLQLRDGRGGIATIIREPSPAPGYKETTHAVR
jgi:hypothetical protein